MSYHEILNNDLFFRFYLTTAMKFYSLSEIDCAELFDVSAPSVRRWLAGATSPHTVIRKDIFRIIESKSGVHNEAAI